MVCLTMVGWAPVPSCSIKHKSGCYQKVFFVDTASAHGQLTLNKGEITPPTWWALPHQLTVVSAKTEPHLCPQRRDSACRRHIEVLPALCRPHPAPAVSVQPGVFSPGAGMGGVWSGFSGAGSSLQGHLPVLGSLAARHAFLAGAEKQEVACQVLLPSICPPPLATSAD